MALGLVAGVLWRSSRRVAPVAGVLLAGAFLLGLDDIGKASGQLAVGIAALGAAGLVASRLPWRGLASAVLAVPGAVLVATAPGVPDGTPLLVVAIGTVLGGTLVADFDDRWGDSGLSPVLIALSTAGVYATVPETGRALVLLGAAVFLPLLGWPVPFASLGRAGAYAATGCLLWVAAVDGQTRGSAVVGAVACLGLFAVEPLGRWLGGRRSALRRLEPLGPRWQWTIAAGLIHLGLVYVGSRVAGLRASTNEALVIAGATLVGATLIAMAVAPAGRRRRVREDARL